MKLKGLRVDPGLLTQEYPTASAGAAAVVNDCKRYGVTTIFVFAYSPVYGRYYFSTLTGTWAETAYGTNLAQNFVAQIIELAHTAGIKVVATFPLNLYQNIAASKPSWRALRQNGQPYTMVYGQNTINPLSAWHPNFRTWFTRLIDDFLSRHPDLDGIEACEGNVANSFETGDVAPDYNTTATQIFKSQYPSGVVGDSNWVKFRAEGMTGLHQIIFEAARNARDLPTYVVNSLACAYQTTTLMTPAAYADGCGFDWAAVANLGFNNFIQETNWQQAEVNGQESGLAAGTFTVDWTSTAIHQFAQRLPAAVPVKMAHVEVTTFSGKTPQGVAFSVGPTVAQFKTALSEALAGSQGVTVYSYSLLKNGAADNGYAGALMTVYTGSAT